MMKSEIQPNPEVDQFLKGLFERQGRDKTAQEVSQESIPEEPSTLSLGLTEGSIRVDDKEVAIPVSVARKLTADAIKALAKVYQGMALYIASGRGWKRLKDTDTIELKNQNFQSRRIIPDVQTAARLNRD